MREIAQTQSFKDLVHFGYIYIDKTEQIFNLLKTRRVFISRPRRFGKSLMLDTIGTLFEFGVDPYFKGTWIYSKWTDITYPVLRFDFLKYTNDYDTFRNMLCKNIWSFARKLNIRDEITSDVSTVEVLFDLFQALNNHGIRIVILIDEYDAQLTANMNNPDIYEKFRIELRNLYGVMKGDPSIRFLCMTGVTRLKDVSVFSVGYDIKDLSYHQPVSAVAGFTRAEIRKYYIDYINLAVSLDKGIPEEQVTEGQRDALLDRLSEEYDGYCFDKFYEKKVFSTWSVNSFFQEVIENQRVVFGDYWYENGGVPSVLENYLQTHDIQISEMLFENNNVSCSISDFLNPTSLLTMNEKVLMCQSGYLTIDSPLEGEGLNVILKIPNREVFRALARLISRKVFQKYKKPTLLWRNVLAKGSTEQIVSELNLIFNTISYEKYPVSNEKVFQGYLHIFLIGARQPVFTEVQSSAGRADIVLEYPQRRLVFELKYAKTDAECEKRLLEAVEQIKTRRYGEVSPQKKCMKLALVFNGDPKTRKITHYAEVR
jgi:hypothetical protein